MKDARDGHDDLFAGMRVERTTRDDGRYVIYFSWPQERPEPSASEREGAHTPPAGKPRPWNVSSGPPDDGPSDEGPGQEDPSDEARPDERGSRV